MSSVPTTPTPVPERRLDLFAPKFIPRSLQNINSFTAAQTFIQPKPAYIDFDEYAQTFLPAPIIHSCPSTLLLRTVQIPRYTLTIVPIPGPQIPLKHVNMQNYAAHFYNLLIEERRALAEDLKQYNLYEVPVRSTPTATDFDLYRIDVPGLREYIPPVIPSIFVGDALAIRAVYSIQGYFDGYEYIGYISGINRREVPSVFAKLTVGIPRCSPSRSDSDVIERTICTN
jgi:hypothetical protein